MPTTLESILTDINTQNGSWTSVRIAQDVKIFLWARYDPNDELIYPVINDWDDLLLNTIKLNSYDTLTYTEVLSILFGLSHRNRIVEGLWWSMFERGVTQRLLERLWSVDTD